MKSHDHHLWKSVSSERRGWHNGRQPALPCWQVAATAHSVISTHVHGLAWPDRSLAVCSDARRKLAASSASAITRHTSHREPVNVRMNTSWVSGRPFALYASMRLNVPYIATVTVCFRSYLHQSTHWPFKAQWALYNGALISLWLYNENKKLQDWKNVFTYSPWAPHTYDFVVLTSLTHHR
jgi:hypothetical protein